MNPGKYLIFFVFLLIIQSTQAQEKSYDTPGAGNPIIPGYFADPSLKKFGDTYYLYATTDGNGGGFGPSQVWISKDFVNWSLQDMNWPTTHHYWAPDVTKAKDGAYYMYYCQPVEIFGAKSDSPVGPWTPLLPAGKPVVPNFLVPDVITLDGQTFRDDDNKMYLFWGTWGIYPNHGCGVGLFNPDMKSFAKLDKIPNTVAKDFFEAPFMFKRKGIYYLTYSSGRCEDDTYRVQYATSTTGPMGPFVYGKNNPVLSTNADGTIHGPGHQSVFQEGDDFYLIYHRHNNPHSGGGYHRQVAADKLVFDAEGNIEKLEPTHTGVGYLAKNANPSPDLALGAAVTAASFYDANFKPEFAVDNNNGTLWKPKNNTSESWLSIDLGAVKKIMNVQTQFEYATWYYQYLIKSSIDGTNWSVFADKTKNTTHGSPMIDVSEAAVEARYVRLTITNTEYPGLNKAIWNVRIFADDKYQPKMLVQAKDPSTIPNIKPQGLLVDLNTDALSIGAEIKEWANQGKLGGAFIRETAGSPLVEMISGQKALVFDGKSSLKSNFKSPESLSGNSSFSVAMWVYNETLQEEEPVVAWTARGGVDMTNASVGYGSSKTFGAAAHWGWADMAYKTFPEAGKWHHIALVFDGTKEKLYVDGLLDHEELKMLFLAELRNFVLGSTDDHHSYFSGALTSLKVYDTPLTEEEVKAMAAELKKSDVAVYLEAGKLPYGPLTGWKNEGYLGGSFKAGPKAPLIEDIAGKIGMRLPGQDALLFARMMIRAIKDTSANALVMQFRGRRMEDLSWHHLIQSYKNGSLQTYIDGVLVPGASLESVNDQYSMESLASVTVYDHSLSAAEVASLLDGWKQTIPAAPGKIVFAQLPKAVSPGIVSMAAGSTNLPGKGLQYYFEYKALDSSANNSGWINETTYTDFNLSADQIYTYRTKARDNYGNVTAPSAPATISTSKDLFSIYTDSFMVTKDLKIGLEQTIWDGFIGTADTAQIDSGILKLASTNTKWDGSGTKGPFLYKNISGDFIAEVTVTDVSGLTEKKANGANDVGVMVLGADSTANLIQNSVFPGWGVGNMVTNLDKRGRLQTNNASAWSFYKHLQIQRSGNLFTLRGSSDGKDWKELPGSPIFRADMNQQAVKVGLFQCTYGPQSGYGSFADFKLFQAK